jgi:hypothetical protein
LCYADIETKPLWTLAIGAWALFAGLRNAIVRTKQEVKTHA